MLEITENEWRKEAKKRYDSFKNVKFKCPVCGYVASVSDYLNAGADECQVGFVCIGRFLEKSKDAFGDNPEKKGPCNYTGGGLIGLNPIRVKFKDGTISDFFDFADDPLVKNK